MSSTDPAEPSVPARTLGPGGPPVGAVGLGCMGMSWAYGAAERDDTQSRRVLRRALDLGVTLIDTADVYGPFTNEELVGSGLRGRRDEAFLATKCGLVAGDDGLVRNGRPEHVRGAIDASLRRLGTDHVDLWQLHRVDPQVPVEETWGAMAESVAAGKALALGMSEVGVEELDRARAVHPVTTVQSELSLWTRDALPEVLPWCVEHGVGFLPFAPLGRGFLTGTLVFAIVLDVTGSYRGALLSLLVLFVTGGALLVSTDTDGAIAAARQSEDAEPL